MRFTSLMAPIVVISMLAAASVEAAKVNWLDQVEVHLQQTKSMTANFTQTDQKKRSISGTLFMKRPGKMRFDYGQNANMLMVADGRQLHFIDYEVSQKSSWDIAKSPLAVLLDDRPNLDRIARIEPTKDDRVVIVRARDARRPEFGTLILAFTKKDGAPGGLQLEGWTAIDAQNKRTAVRLTGQRYNIGVADSQFSYAEPK